MKTIFCDIDRTICSFESGYFSDVISGDEVQKILPGVRKRFDEWSRNGYKVYLTTARKETLRGFTEKQLMEWGLHYDMLIMGVGNGPRYLINDVKGDKSPGAYAINVERNVGMENLEI